MLLWMPSYIAFVIICGYNLLVTLSPRYVIELNISTNPNIKQRAWQVGKTIMTLESVNRGENKDIQKVRLPI